MVYCYSPDHRDYEINPGGDTLSEKEEEEEDFLSGKLEEEEDFDFPLPCSDSSTTDPQPILSEKRPIEELDFPLPFDRYRYGTSLSSTLPQPSLSEFYWRDRLEEELEEGRRG
jgi:hypothetical protein